MARADYCASGAAQGALRFATIEPELHHIVDDSPDLRLAVLDFKRSSDVRADTPVDCFTLSSADFARIEHERPALAIRLLRNLLQGSTETSAQLTREVAAMEG